MPTIRPYTSQEQAYSGGLQTRASPMAFGAGTAQALEGLGGTIVQMGPQLQAAQDRMNEDVIANATSTYDPSLKMFEAQKTATDPVQAAKDVPNWMQADIDAHINNNPHLVNNPRAAAEVRRRLSRRIPGVMSEQATWAVNAVDANSKRLANEGLNAIQNRIFGDPNSYELSVTDSDALIDRQLDIPVTEREAMKVKQRQQLAAWRFQSLTVDATTTEGLDALEKELTGDVWGGRMDPKDVDNALRDIKTVRSALTSQFNAQAQAGVNSLIDRNTHADIIPVDEMQAITDLAIKANNPAILKTLGNIQVQQNEYRVARKMSATRLKGLEYEEVPHASGNATSFLSPLLAPGHDSGHITGLQAQFADKLTALIQAAPSEVKAGLGVLSGYRTYEEQQRLWKDALDRYGSPGVARKHVAPPGSSQHNHGNAVDLSWNGNYFSKAPQSVQNWVHANLANYGLNLPMDYEPWHIEDATARSRGSTTGDAATRSLADAVLSVESGGDPNAVSPAGAVGLMQIMPMTGREIALELGDKNFPIEGSQAQITEYLKDPEVSKRYGAHYLNKMMNKYGGDVEAALISYNAGSTVADAFLKENRDYSLLPQETQDYIAKVRAAMGDSGTDEQTFLRTEARQRIANEQDAAFKRGDGMRYWRDAFAYPTPDLNQPGGFAQLSRQTMEAADFYDKPLEDMTPFTTDQTAQMTQAIKDDETGKTTLSLMAGMQSMDPQVARGGAKQLGVNDPGFEFLSRLYPSRPDIAQAAIAGRKAREAFKGGPMIADTGNQDKDLETQFAALVDKSLDLRADRNTIKEEAFNLFVDRYFTRGKGVPGAETWSGNDEAIATFNQAVNEVMGARGGTPMFGNVNGKITKLPPNMDGETFDAVLDKLTPADYISASEDGNPPRYVENQVVPTDVIANEGVFRLIKDDPELGHVYQIQLSDGNFLLSEPGKPYNFMFEKVRAKTMLEAPPMQPITGRPPPATGTGLSGPMIEPGVMPEPGEPLPEPTEGVLRGDLLPKLGTITPMEPPPDMPTGLAGPLIEPGKAP